VEAKKEPGKGRSPSLAISLVEESKFDEVLEALDDMVMQNCLLRDGWYEDCFLSAHCDAIATLVRYGDWEFHPDSRAGYKGSKARPKGGAPMD
jgi:hypothetical protein